MHPRAMPASIAAHIHRTAMAENLTPGHARPTVLQLSPSSFAPHCCWTLSKFHGRLV